MRIFELGKSQYKKTKYKMSESRNVISNQVKLIMK